MFKKLYLLNNLFPERVIIKLRARIKENDFLYYKAKIGCFAIIRCFTIIRSKKILTID